MSRIQAAKQASNWLSAHPAPIHIAKVAAWSELVRADLGRGAFGELVELLEHGDLEQQDQAVAAARALGAEVWAEGTGPDLIWLVTLPGEANQRTIRPDHRLAD